MKKTLNQDLNRLSAQSFKEAPKTPLVIVLDNIRSLHNIGSVFRTCDGFLIEKLYLCGITATPPHRDIHKTALGAELTVAWQYEAHALQLVHALKQQGFYTAAVEQAEGAENLTDFWPKPLMKTALIFGNEVSGVSQEVVSACDSVIEIPQFGSKHSLNVSVSVGIVIWDVFGKLCNRPFVGTLSQ